MDTLTSTEFRKRYASLTRETAVTVNGHPIGEWHPRHGTSALEVYDEEVRAEPLADMRGFGHPRAAPKPSRR